MSQMTRRWLALATTAVIVAGACGSTATQAPSSQAPGGSAPAAGSQAPAATSADFSMPIDADPSSFAGSPSDDPTQQVDYGLFGNAGLVYLDNKLAPQPGLAAKLPDVSADGLTWTFTLRDNLKWSDGQPLTADDVTYTFNLLASKNCTQNPQTCSDVAQYITSISNPDAKTVVFVFKNKYAPFLATDAAAPILPKHAIEASFARFQQQSTGVVAADVKALADKISAAMSDAACTGEATQPATCNAGTYVADVEAMLQKASVTLPDKNTYKDSTGAVDQNAYGQALITQLNDLNTTLASSAIDQVAASLRLLDYIQPGKWVGAGPYVLTNYTAGQSLTLTKNPNYYRVMPGPEKWYIPIIKDSATASNALKQGDILFQYRVDSDALQSVQSDPNLTTSEFPDFGYYYIGFNMRPGRLYADKNLRQAFTMCIDHDKTVAAATDNLGMPIQAEVPPASWAYNPDVPKYTLDVPGAKKLIEASGWTLGSDGVYAKAGKRLSSTLYVRAGKPQRIAFAQLAKDQLKQCGIEVNVKESDFQAVLMPLIQYPNNFDTYLGGWSVTTDPDDSSIFASNQCPTKETPDAFNLVCYNSPQADALFTQGQQTFDQNARKQIYYQLQVMLHNDAPYYFLWADKLHRGYSKRVSAQSPETIDYTSPLDYWNMDNWTVAAR
jgi:ABC-type transport system substrate-binding protein